MIDIRQVSWYNEKDVLAQSLQDKEGNGGVIMYRILYNPLSAHGKGKALAKNVREHLRGESYSFCDMREISDYKAYFAKLEKDDAIVITGGDGTLNRFINDTDGILPDIDVYYYPAGSGNDFYHDISALG